MLTGLTTQITARKKLLLAGSKAPAAALLLALPAVHPLLGLGQQVALAVEMKERGYWLPLDGKQGLQAASSSACTSSPHTPSAKSVF